MPSGGFDYVLLDEEPRKILAGFSERNRFFQGDILWLGFQTKLIPYHRQQRAIGASQWTLPKKIKYFIDGLLNTSYLPIRFMSLIGFTTAFSGFAYAGVVVCARILNKQPFVGWAPLMIVNLIVSGILMIMMGIIGEYICASMTRPETGLSTSSKTTTRRWTLMTTRRRWRTSRCTLGTDSTPHEAPDRLLRHIHVSLYDIMRLLDIGALCEP